MTSSSRGEDTRDQQISGGDSGGPMSRAKETDGRVSGSLHPAGLRFELAEVVEEFFVLDLALGEYGF